MIERIDEIYDGARFRICDREKARVYGAVCARPGCTRQEISRTLNLRPTSVCTYVNELIASRLVNEQPDKTKLLPGRPRLLLYPHFNRYAAVSMRVESMELKGALINIGEEILANHETPVPRDTDGQRFLRICSDMIENLGNRAPDGCELLGAAISLVGTVAAAEKTWISAARLQRIRNVKFDSLAASCGIAVTINRVLDAELEYQLAKNAAFRAGNCILFHWGFGIGSSYAHKGDILTSTIGRFGEIGHTRLRIGSKKNCLCGESGCLETEAALWSILPEIRRSFPDAPEDESELAGFTRRRPSVARHPALVKALASVTEGLLNLYKLFYPDVILIIGPFIEMNGVFEKLTARFYDSIPDFAKNAVRLKAVHGGFRGSMFGCVYPFLRNKLRKKLIFKH